MSLSKQLYIIISFIFLLIFTGNFLISVKNTKEYLTLESFTKAQDTATSLGMSLRNDISNNRFPEVESTVKAIANRGFYKEIRIEQFDFEFTNNFFLSRVIEDKNYTLKNVLVDPSFGTIVPITNDDSLQKQLDNLDKIDDLETTFTQSKTDAYSFIPSKKVGADKNVTFTLVLIDEDKNEVKKEIVEKIDSVIAKVVRSEKFEYVPQWFVNMIQINMLEQTSEITNGWKTIARIYVSANAGDAYAKLYEQAKASLLYSVLAFVISIGLLYIFVQLILRPLKNIENLANKIANGNFGTIAKLPYTTEIKNVAIAMNDMSGKIENVITKLQNNLDKITEKMSKDDLTGLSLKQTFETDMKNIFIHKKEGYVLSIKLSSLAEYAKTHTNKEINNFIKEFAFVIQNTKYKNKEITAYRFFGSEFSAIIKDVSYEEVKEYLEELKNNLDELSVKYHKAEISHIGATPINIISSTHQILEAANEAYEKAKLIGPNECFVRDNSDLARDVDEWKNLVFDVIDNSKFKVNYIGDTKILANDELLMQEAFTSASDSKGNDIPIGTFISIAEKYNKIIEFDKKVIEKIKAYMLENSINHQIIVNLSYESTGDKNFISWLEKFVNNNREVSDKFVFGVSAYTVNKDFDSFKNFCQIIHNLNCKIIVKRYEPKFIPIDTIKDINIDYIRMAREFTHELKNNHTKQNLIDGIIELSKLVNIKVIAENVKDEDDKKIIKELGIYASSF